MGHHGKPHDRLTGPFVLGVSARHTAGHLHTDLSKLVREKTDSLGQAPQSVPVGVGMRGGKLG